MLETLDTSFGREQLVRLERAKEDAGEAAVTHDLQLLVQFFTTSDDYWTGKGVISDVNTGIRGRFEEAGIGFAFPTQTTVIESDPDAPPRVHVEGALERPGEGGAEEGENEEDGKRARSGAKPRHESGEGTRREGFDEEGTVEDGEGEADGGDDGGDGR